MRRCRRRIVDSGNFDWEAQGDKFACLVEPDPSYHGVSYTKEFGKAAFITTAVAQLMRDLGSIPSPQNAFYLNLGLESLHVRVPRHCENALAVARFLEGHKKVSWINYPDLRAANTTLAKSICRQEPRAFSFGVRGGRRLQVYEALSSPRSKRMSPTRIPACCTRKLDPQAAYRRAARRSRCGSIIRLSVGIENEDIIADVHRRLKRHKT